MDKTMTTNFMEPQWHEITFPDNSFRAILDLSRHSGILKAVARSNGVKYSSKTGAPTDATAHLYPTVRPIDHPRSLMNDKD